MPYPPGVSTAAAAQTPSAAAAAGSTGQQQPYQQPPPPSGSPKATSGPPVPGSYPPHAHLHAHMPGTGPPHVGAYPPHYAAAAAAHAQHAAAAGRGAFPAPAGFPVATPVPAGSPTSGRHSHWRSSATSPHGRLTQYPPAAAQHPASSPRSNHTSASNNSGATPTSHASGVSSNSAKDKRKLKASRHRIHPDRLENIEGPPSKRQRSNPQPSPRSSYAYPSNQQKATTPRVSKSQRHQDGRGDTSTPNDSRTPKNASRKMSSSGAPTSSGTTSSTPPVVSRPAIELKLAPKDTVKAIVTRFFAEFPSKMILKYVHCLGN